LYHDSARLGATQVRDSSVRLAGRLAAAAAAARDGGDPRPSRRLVEALARAAVADGEGYVRAAALDGLAAIASAAAAAGDQASGEGRLAATGLTPAGVGGHHAAAGATHAVCCCLYSLSITSVESGSPAFPRHADLSSLSQGPASLAPAFSGRRDRCSLLRAGACLRAGLEDGEAFVRRAAVDLLARCSCPPVAAAGGLAMVSASAAATTTSGSGGSNGVGEVAAGCGRLRPALERLNQDSDWEVCGVGVGHEAPQGLVRLALAPVARPGVRMDMEGGVAGILIQSCCAGSARLVEI
jgi:hypothetical protein